MQQKEDNFSKTGACKAPSPCPDFPGQTSSKTRSWLSHEYGTTPRKTNVLKLGTHHHHSNSYITFKLGLACAFPRGMLLLSISKPIPSSHHMGCPCFWKPCPRCDSSSLQFNNQNCTGYCSWGLTKGLHSSIKIFSPLLKTLHCLHSGTTLAFLISSSWLSCNQTFPPVPWPAHKTLTSSIISR